MTASRPGWFARLGTSRLHVLPVEAPGAWTVRAGLEQDVQRRGWAIARSPADADALVVCGRAGLALEACIERVWRQLPGPRARQAVSGDAHVNAALDDVRNQLLDDGAQRADAAARASWPKPDEQMAPRGIALAEGAPGRDGLEMDVVHLPLGPVLLHWPAGLVLRTRLHGDVVTEASVEVLGAAEPDGKAERLSLSPSMRSARRIDDAYHLLALTGWTAGARAARSLRDDLLADAADLDDLLGLRQRVKRSLTLGWLLRSLALVDTSTEGSAVLPDHLRGDCYDRLLRLFETEPDADTTGAERSADAVLVALPSIVTGLELGSVRLAVASLGLRTEVASVGARDAAHG